MNRWVILVPVIIVVVIAGLWASETVPVIPGSQVFKIAVVPVEQHAPQNFTWWQGIDILMLPHGGTVSGTYWAPNGDSIEFTAEGASFYRSNGTSGSFTLNYGNSPSGVTFVFVAYAPDTVLINVTVSYHVPLI